MLLPLLYFFIFNANVFMNTKLCSNVRILANHCHCHNSALIITHCSLLSLYSHVSSHSSVSALGSSSLTVSTCLIFLKHNGYNPLCDDVHLHFKSNLNPYSSPSSVHQCRQQQRKLPGPLLWFLRVSAALGLSTPLNPQQQQQ